MSPLKLSYSIEKDGKEIPGQVVPAADGMRTLLQTPAGEAWAKAVSPRFPHTGGVLGLLKDSLFGRALMARFPGDIGYPWQSSGIGDEEVARVEKIKTSDGTVTIKAVSYSEKK